MIRISREDLNGCILVPNLAHAYFIVFEILPVQHAIDYFLLIVTRRFQRILISKSLWLHTLFFGPLFNELVSQSSKFLVVLLLVSFLLLGFIFVVVEPNTLLHAQVIERIPELWRAHIGAEEREQFFYL